MKTKSSAPPHKKKKSITNFMVTKTVLVQTLSFIRSQYVVEACQYFYFILIYFNIFNHYNFTVV